MEEIINDLTEKVTETDEQRAQRLEETGANAGVNPETLYEIEEEVREQTRALASDHQETIDQGLGQLQQFALFLLDPEDAATLLQTESVITLLSQGISENPRELATAVKAIDQVLEQRGLYEQMEIDDEDVAGALEDVVDESE